jgi:NAD(P)H-hydrate epimerase
MLKIYNSLQIRKIDEYTITHEPISPYDLMERASGELFSRITRLINRNSDIMVFAGTGNNGGDGLAIARMLVDAGYQAFAYIINVSSGRTPEWETNYQRLQSFGGTRATMVNDKPSIPVITSGAVVIDAIFGSGLTRQPEGVAAEAIMAINNSDSTVISIDMPSGLPGEDCNGFERQFIVKADYTFVIEFPRLSFFFAENNSFVGNWKVVPIGLHPTAIAGTDTPFRYVDSGHVARLLRKRGKFDNKGNFGHALLVAGSQGKMGAAILAAKAVLRTGAGLLTCHIPSNGATALHAALPEAMIDYDSSETLISEIPDSTGFNAVAIGPGIGTDDMTINALGNFLSGFSHPLVIDADAINIIGLNRHLLKLIPPSAVLTPHPREFARLAGESDNGFARLQKQIAFSREYSCTVVLKGAHTSVSTPDGKVYFNSTGNPGMATAGSGDVLTGVILGLLSQGYAAENAAVAGVFLHGLAGDIAAGNSCMEALIASDITDNLHAAYTKIQEQLL